jgi:hypothetical protein
MGRIIPMLSLHAFMAWTGTALLLPISCLFSQRSQKKIAVEGRYLSSYFGGPKFRYGFSVPFPQL